MSVDIVHDRMVVTTWREAPVTAAATHMRPGS
jgi:hypothetical protein